MTSRPQAIRARPPGLAMRDRVQDQLAALRNRELGRDIGCCARCGKPVRSQQNFMREDGQVEHLRCRVLQR